MWIKWREVKILPTNFQARQLTITWNEVEFDKRNSKDTVNERDAFMLRYIPIMTTWSKVTTHYKCDGYIIMKCQNVRQELYKVAEWTSLLW